MGGGLCPLCRPAPTISELETGAGVSLPSFKLGEDGRETRLDQLVPSEVRGGARAWEPMEGRARVKAKGWGGGGEEAGKLD